ncbi:MAG: T9SS type A sorting domain-containing protein, partial [Bacteroidota bacterium]|nr:T9SS type A sorting domain-containing protein [Bacteroidota bacterium]
MADGSPLIMTGPAAGQGPADNKWDERTGYGNGGSVLTSAEAGGEDAPLIKTRVVVPEGTYDFWVNFWGNPDEDWRIKAGLSLDHMQLFREMACRQVEAGEYQDSMDVAGSGNTFLYQAYLGRIRVSNGDTVNIFVDDSAVAAGSVNSLTGGAVRTWYDGISYAVVNGASVLAVNARTGNLPSLYSLSQNYPNPFNPTTTIRFAIPVSPRGQAEFVSLKVYDLLGREVATLVNEVKKAGSYTVTFDGSKLASGVYFYRMKAGSC